MPRCAVKLKLESNYHFRYSTGIPAPPIKLKLINATHDSITLSWEPSFDGGVAQTFRVRYTKQQSKHANNEVEFTNVLTPAESSSITISGLDPDSEYVFAVFARNNLGESGPSREISVHTRPRPRLPARTLPPLEADAAGEIKAKSRQQEKKTRGANVTTALVPPGEPHSRLDPNGLGSLMVDNGSYIIAACVAASVVITIGSVYALLACYQARKQRKRIAMQTMAAAEPTADANECQNLTDSGQPFLISGDFARSYCDCELPGSLPVPSELEFAGESGLTKCLCVGGKLRCGQRTECTWMGVCGCVR